MSNGSAKICPSCGTRNKRTWEFCVRCGESLAAVTASSGKSAEAPPAAKAAATGAGFPWGTAALIVLLPLGALAAWRWYAAYPAATKKPEGALIMPRADATPPPAASAEQPGAAAFEEGRRRLAAGDAGGAEPLLAQAVKEGPSNIEYHMEYARCLDKLGRGDAAVIELRVARNLDPHDRTVALELARVLEEGSSPQEAAGVYEGLVATDPNDPEALRGLVKIYQDGDDPARALPYMRRLAEASPDDLVTTQQLGEARHLAGDYAEAAQVLSPVVEAKPEALLPRAWLTEALSLQGRHDQAIQVARKGVALQPQAPLLHRVLGNALDRAGRAAEAAEEYRTYVKLAPNAEDARQWAARAKEIAPQGGS